MKRIKFKLLQNEDAVKSDGAEPSFVLNSKPYSEANEKIAKAEAYNGEYTIEDDGKPEPAPTQIDRIEAQVAYTALMTDTLIESEG